MFFMRNCNCHLMYFFSTCYTYDSIDKTVFSVMQFPLNIGWNLHTQIHLVGKGVPFLCECLMIKKAKRRTTRYDDLFLVANIQWLLFKDVFLLFVLLRNWHKFVITFSALCTFQLVMKESSKWHKATWACIQLGENGSLGFTLKIIH